MSTHTNHNSSSSGWVITVKERNSSVRGKAKKNRDQSFTLFVLTPQSHLAINRTLDQLIEFDSILRSTYPTLFQTLPPPPPIILTPSSSKSNRPLSLSSLPSFSISNKRVTISVMPSTTLTSASQQPTHSIKKNKTTTKQVFQSISRTLSPAKPNSSTSSHTKSSNLPPTPPQSPEKTNTSDHEHHEEDFVDVNLSENEKRTINQTEVIKQSEQVQIGIYLSNLSSTPLDQTNNQIREEIEQESHHGLLKDTNEWKEFFKIRKDDVERERKLPNKPQSVDNLTTGTNTTTTTDVSNSDISNTSIDQVSLKQTNSSKTQISLDPTDTTQSSTISENEVTQTKRDQSKISPVDGSVINHLSLEFSSPTICLPTFSSPKIISLPTLEPSLSSPTNTEPPLPSSASSIASSSATTTKPSLTPMTPAEVISEEITKDEISTTPSPIQTRISKSKIGLKDFECIRVLGKGCAGKVLMVKYKSNINHKQNQSVYAMKSIRKNHVLAHRELQHTLTEQSVLKRVANEPGSNPFIVRLWWSFHDKDHLFLVMDFHPGGDLATQLARWGRLGRDRARFYAAEITEGVTSLHKSGVIYRDLKPENILIAFDGHIVLTDFGLSKQFKSNDEVEERTMTFCGTAEYLAPEVLLGEPYSYEVDWWSFGTMLFEMLTGLTPFWSEDHATMYRRVLHDELTFNEDSSRVMDHDTKTLLRGLLQRNPAVRMTGTRIKKHPYFGMIDWDHVRHKRYIPPYVPAVNPNDATDTQNFDETFLAMEPTHVQDEDPTSVGVGDKEGGEDKEIEPVNEEAETVGKVEPEKALDEDGNDVFDGYSFLAPRDERDSIIEEDTDEVNDNNNETKPEDLNQIQNQKTSSSVNDEVNSTHSPSGLDSEQDTVDQLNKRKSASKKSELNKPESIATSKIEEEGGLEEEEDWDVIDVPEGGVTDCNGRRKRTNNTLFARGVVDKYKLRMKIFNEPGMTVGNLVRANSVSRNSTSSTNRPTSDSSDNGIINTSPNPPPSTSQTKPRRRFGLRSKPNDRQRTLSPMGGSIEVEQRSGAGRLIKPNFLKGRSMSHTVESGLTERLSSNDPNSSSTPNGGKKRLNLNGFLSSQYLGGSGNKQNDLNHNKTSDPRTGLSRSTSDNKAP